MVVHNFDHTHKNYNNGIIILMECVTLNYNCCTVSVGDYTRLRFSSVECSTLSCIFWLVSLRFHLCERRMNKNKIEEGREVGKKKRRERKKGGPVISSSIAPS